MSKTFRSYLLALGGILTFTASAGPESLMIVPE